MENEQMQDGKKSEVSKINCCELLWTVFALMHLPAYILVSVGTVVVSTL